MKWSWHGEEKKLTKIYPICFNNILSEFASEVIIHVMRYSLRFILFSLFGFAGCTFTDSKHTKNFVSITKLAHTINGRYENVNDYLSFSCSGVSLTFLAPESEFYIWIEDSASNADSCNWLNVLISGKYYNSIHLKPGKRLYKINGTIDKDLITLIKATEPMVGEVRIYGLELSKPFDDAQAFDISYKHHIQFIGNSITSGYGNMVSIRDIPNGNPLTGFHPKNENAYQSYAMQTARNLNASCMLVSFSGKGMYRNFSGDTSETLPKIYDRIHLNKKKSALWDHSKQIPDIIVINLGSNDYYLERANNPVKDSVFVQTYIQFLTKLIGLYPEAAFICVNGPMMNDTWPEGKNCCSRIQSNIKTVAAYFKSNENRKMYTFFFDPQTEPFGEDYHPSLATHTKMAEDLTNFIKTEVIHIEREKRN